MKKSPPPQFPSVLFQTARSWRTQLDQRLKPLGLSQAKWRLLLQLSRAEQLMTQKDLAERMGVEGPTIVGLIDRLAKNGWVERRPHREDRRSKTIHLTPKAGKIINKIQNISTQLRQEVLSFIPESDLDNCLNVLLRIKKCLDQDSFLRLED